MPNPEAEGLTPDAYEVIGEKVSHRLAQRPGSYVVLKYVRPLIKRRDTQVLSCPPAPVGVIDGSRADVSFIAGMMVDKFAYHLPLYRQHQRLRDAGFKVSRHWLTQLALDGTDFFSSNKIHCKCCSCAEQKNGDTLYRHIAVTPVLVAPGQEQVIVLPSEFVQPQDGHDKQDCETAASARWLSQHAAHSAAGANWGAMTSRPTASIFRGPTHLTARSRPLTTAV